MTPNPETFLLDLFQSLPGPRGIEVTSSCASVDKCRTLRSRQTLEEGKRLTASHEGAALVTCKGELHIPVGLVQRIVYTATATTSILEKLKIVTKAHALLL
jgi:hypothetical protein